MTESDMMNLYGTISDPDVCKQVDNIDHVYDIDRLHAMYDFLSSNGNCYYIQYQGKLVGDVSLRNNAELALIIFLPTLWCEAMKSST